jgi:UDP-N-acetylglucosamine 2-epimerase
MRERFSWIDPSKKLLLVTGHRRENLGERLAAICEALLKLSAREDVQICYVVHLNPNVRNPVRKILRQSTQVKLLGPQDYLSFVYLMSRSHLRITDSGGVQEEAPKTTEN